MKVLERIENPFGGIDEQAMTDQLESVVGSSNKCFRLMRLRQENPNDGIFRKKALNAGFRNRDIDAFLDYQSVV